MVVPAPLHMNSCRMKQKKLKLSKLYRCCYHLYSDENNTENDDESIRPELASSKDVGDDASQTTLAAAAVRRNEAALLKDSLALETEPVFDDRGNRPRKVPQILCPNRAEPARRMPMSSKKTTPVKASVGNVRKRKSTTNKSLITTKMDQAFARKEDTGNKRNDCATPVGGRTRAWTESEDELLREKYAELGPKWSEIAQTITGRSDQACRAQFNRPVEQPKGPSVGYSMDKKRAHAKIWTPQDDQTLLDLHAKHGPNWNKITQFVAGTTYHGCRARFKRLTNGKQAPKMMMLQVPLKNKRDWTAKEDSILQQKHAIHGNKWCRIAKSLPNRNGDACRRRFTKLHPARIVSKRGLSKNKDKPTMMSGRRTRLTEEDRRILRAYVPTRYVLKGKG